MEDPRKVKTVERNEGMQSSGSSSSKDHCEVIKDDGDERMKDRAAEEGSEEARHAKPATTPRTPTPEEYRIHRLTHLPYRSWCPHCVKAKKRNTGHKKISKEGKRNIPMISIDYMFTNNKGEDHANPTLVIKDHWRGGVWAFMVIRKGSQTTYIT